MTQGIFLVIKASSLSYDSKYGPPLRGLGRTGKPEAVSRRPRSRLHATARVGCSPGHGGNKYSANLTRDLLRYTVGVYQVSGLRFRIQSFGIGVYVAGLGLKIQGLSNQRSFSFLRELCLYWVSQEREVLNCSRMTPPVLQEGIQMDPSGPRV